MWKTTSKFSMSGHYATSFIWISWKWNSWSIIGLCYHPEYVVYTCSKCYIMRKLILIFQRLKFIISELKTFYCILFFLLKLMDSIKNNLRRSSLPSLKVVELQKKLTFYYLLELFLLCCWIARVWGGGFLTHDFNYLISLQFQWKLERMCPFLMHTFFAP